jgi:integral membrane protein
MIKIFKVVALLEGLSLLILIFIAMPLKYIFELPLYVKFIGMAHGFLFISYMTLVIYFFIEKSWGFKKCVFASLASIIPFGTFYFEKKLL